VRRRPAAHPDELGLCIVRLSSGHRRWVYWTAAAVFGSGVLWLIFHYFLEAEGQFGPSPHPLEQWWLRLHGAAAMVCLLVVGSLLPVHVRRSWHQRRNLPVGIVLATVLLVLLLSGYALYYFGGEQTRVWISTLHWGIGIGSPLVLLWHIASGRRGARDKPPAAMHRGRPVSKWTPGIDAGTGTERRHESDGHVTPARHQGSRTSRLRSR